jgi:predicted PurR-regulated permease PerM
MTLHPLLVFLSMFGGLAVFGMMGLLVGPLIASIFMAMVRIYRRDFLGLRPVSMPVQMSEPVAEPRSVVAPTPSVAEG